MRGRPLLCIVALSALFPAIARADDEKRDHDRFGLSVPAGKAAAYGVLALEGTWLTGTPADAGTAYDRKAGLLSFEVSRTSPAWKTVLGAMGGYDLRIAVGFADLAKTGVARDNRKSTGIALARFGVPIAIATTDGRAGFSIEVGGELGYDGGRTYGPGVATPFAALALGVAPTESIGVRLDYTVLPLMIDTGGLDDVVEQRLGLGASFGAFYIGGGYAFGIARSASFADHYSQLGAKLGLLVRL